MEQAAIIGIDISKKSFQLHGATAEGEPVFRKTLSRGRFLAFLSEVPSCLVVMEACGGAHHWGRAIIDLGHACKLIPPVYVKPFVRRQKNDSNDAAAIVEAAQRPTMRFVAVKSEAAQSDSMLFRTRALLVRQRTQTVNSLRGHLAEFGVIAPLGPGGVEKLRRELEAVRESLPEQGKRSFEPLRFRKARITNHRESKDSLSFHDLRHYQICQTPRLERMLTEQVASMATLLLTQIAALSGRIADLEKEIRVRARERAEMKRLMTIPGGIDRDPDPAMPSGSPLMSFMASSLHPSSFRFRRDRPASRQMPPPSTIRDSPHVPVMFKSERLKCCVRCSKVKQSSRGKGYST